MRYLVTAEEMRQYDQNTIETIGVPGPVLMERAALRVAERIKQYLARINSLNPIVLILCGVGNNGGDGLAVARLLSDAGIRVNIWVTGNLEKASDQWKLQRKILKVYQKKEIIQFCDEPEKDEYTVVVDALFGVGLSRDLEGIYAEAIQKCNALKGYKIALDVPSGIHSDNGRIMGKAFCADMTVTFGYGKRGLFLHPGCEYSGTVITEDIGINELAFMGKIPHMFYLEEPLKELMPSRASYGNKGTFGKILLIAGSKNMAGAAILSAKAAFCAGCGMVKILSDMENRGILQTSVPDAMMGGYEDLVQGLEWCDVIAAGPGLSQSNEAKECLNKVLELCDKPLVLDADALNLIAIAPDGVEMLRKQTQKGRQIILTPHPGELARLMKTDIEMLKSDPVVQVANFSKNTGCIIVEKNAVTLIFEPEGRICLNPIENSGLAVAGSGDVLCGLITGLLAQKQDTFKAATVGVRLHSELGNRERKRKSTYGMTASDLVSDGLNMLFE